MDAESFFDSMPFTDLVGVELVELGDGHAVGELPLTGDVSWNPDGDVAHGGAVFTLADTVGGAALVSLVDQPVPTVDMRIDYLSAATEDLRAEAEVVRRGDDVGTVDVTVTAGDAHVAEARGVYKTG